MEATIPEAPRRKLELVFMTGIFMVSLLIATWLTYHLHGSPKTGIDDANIFFSYAENLADGRGLVYGHAGERVEGFTSMLWVLICALMFQLSGGGERGVFVISFLLLCITQVVFLTIIRRQAASLGRRSWPYELVFFLLVLSSPAYISWMTITLMDTCLWGTIVAFLLYLAVYPPESLCGRVLATCLVAIAPTARPEASLFVPLVVVLVWIRTRISTCSNFQWFPAILFGAFALSLLTLTAFRLAYFGYPLPNTYYAKVSPSLVYNLFSGARYAGKFLAESALISVFFLGLAVNAVLTFGSFFSSARRSKPDVFGRIRGLLADPEPTVSVVALALFIMPILTGGDHFALFRFYQPLFPVLCLWFVLSVGKIEQSGSLLRAARDHSLRTLTIFLVCMTWFLSSAYTTSWVSLRLKGSPIQHEFGIAQNGLFTGRKLGRLFRDLPDYPSIGVIVAGGIARSYPGRIIDLMGLNTSFIAHFPGDRRGVKNHAAFEKEAFWAIEPDILLASPPAEGQSANFSSQVLKGLLFEPRFGTTWRYGTLTSGTDPGAGFEAFYSTKFLRRMDKEERYRFEDTRIWTGKGWAPDCHGGKPKTSADGEQTPR